MKTKLKKAKNSYELGSLLGLTPSETAEMDFRSELTVALAKIIKEGSFTHEQIAKKAGTARTRVTAIANGNTKGISTDVLIRVLGATGHKPVFKIKKAS